MLLSDSTITTFNGRIEEIIATPRALLLVSWFLRGVVPYVCALAIFCALFLRVVKWVRVWKALRPLPGPTDNIPFWMMYALYRSRAEHISVSDATTGKAFVHYFSFCRRQGNKKLVSKYGQE